VGGKRSEEEIALGQIDFRSLGLPSHAKNALFRQCTKRNKSIFSDVWKDLSAEINFPSRHKVHFFFLLLRQDLEYWGVDELLLEPCCALKYYPEIELCVKEVEGEERSRAKQAERKATEDFGDTRVGRARKWLWNLTEYPETSFAAEVRTSAEKVRGVGCVGVGGHACLVAR